MVGHVTPEAFHGGPLAALEEGDTVVLDVEARELRVELSDDELEAPARRLVAAGAPLQDGRPRQVREARLVGVGRRHHPALANRQARRRRTRATSIRPITPSPRHAILFERGYQHMSFGFRVP